MNGSVVVDASLAVKWLVEEDDSDKAHAALQSWVARDVTRMAPYLMPFEVANALHRRVLRGELNVGDSSRMITRLLGSVDISSHSRESGNPESREVANFGIVMLIWSTGFRPRIKYGVTFFRRNDEMKFRNVNRT